jgi:hypothetical protein
MLAFRDHLRSDPDDLALYRRTKQGLARRTWELVQQYADAKGPVVEDIIARALRRGAVPVTGVHVLLPEGDERAGDLAASLGVPLLDLEELGAAAGDPAAARRVVAAVCSRAPASVVGGDLGATVLPGRLLAVDGTWPAQVEELARAVRQVARYPG